VTLRSAGEQERQHEQPSQRDFMETEKLAPENRHEPGETVLVKRDPDGLLVVTLNRPHKANAKNKAMQHHLLRLVEEADKDDGTRVIILTGAGDRAFCAGMDLGEVRFSRTAGAQQIREDFALYQAMEECSKPLIAAVNGDALGGGLDLVLLSDLAIAERHARFGCPETAIGITPTLALARLPLHVGPKRAADMVLRSRLIQAEEACEWGLVNEMVDTGRSLQRAIDLGREMSRAGQQSLSATSLCLRSSNSSTFVDELCALTAGLFETEDFRRRMAERFGQ